MNKPAIFWLIIILTILSTGCSAIVKAEQPAVVDSVILDNSNSIGQTFNANFDGMNGVEVYLAPMDSGDGEIQLTLRTDPQSENLDRSSLLIKEISVPGYYFFPLSVQPDSNQQGYYYLLRTKGSGSVKVGTGLGASYLNGALYANGQPDDQRQSAFQLSYYVPRLALGLLGEVFLWGWYLLVAAFLFVLPGWALLTWAFAQAERPCHEWHWTLKLTLSIGISLAIYPMIMLLTHSINLQLGPLYAWLPPIVGLLTIIWQNHRHINIKIFHAGKWRPDWVDISFIAVTLIIFTARFWIIRMVQIPLWGDSLQHAMISQLILENNGLFSSWQPFIPYYSFTIHFGFSVFSALFSWITGMDGTQGTLWIGQILNGLAILTLYPLAIKISNGNRWAGIGTLIVGGLIAALPAVYVNWGRFAQLAGQAVLPVALYLLWEATDRDSWKPSSEWPAWLLGGITLTGMVLSYYRMPFYYVAFVIPLLLLWGLPNWGLNIKTWSEKLFRILIIGLIALILFIPWGVRLAGSNLVANMATSITAITPSINISSELEYFRRLTDYFPLFSLFFASIAIIWGLIRKNWFVIGIFFWFIILIGYMVGSVIDLPAANTLIGFAIQISTYIPIALLTGWLFGEFMQRIVAFNSKWISGMVNLMVIFAAIWFGWQQRLVLDLHHYQLVTPADQRAIDWIESQVPSQANFLVQSFEYIGTTAGSDAGWWITLLTHEDSMLPPQYPQVNEVSQPPDYTQQIVDLVTLIQNKSITAPESIAALCDWGITHLYNGQGQGQIGGPPLYTPGELQTRKDIFTRIYYQDRVSIFSFNPSACTH